MLTVGIVIYGIIGAIVTSSVFISENILSEMWTDGKAFAKRENLLPTILFVFIGIVLIAMYAYGVVIWPYVVYKGWQNR